MIGLVVYLVILGALLGAEIVGLSGRLGERWVPLTDYVRRSPFLLRFAVYVFCTWLVMHFSVGLA